MIDTVYMVLSVWKYLCVGRFSPTSCKFFLNTSYYKGNYEILFCISSSLLNFIWGILDEGTIKASANFVHPIALNVSQISDLCVVHDSLYYLTSLSTRFLTQLGFFLFLNIFELNRINDYFHCVLQIIPMYMLMFQEKSNLSLPSHIWIGKLGSCKI